MFKDSPQDILLRIHRKYLGILFIMVRLAARISNGGSVKPATAVEEDMRRYAVCKCFFYFHLQGAWSWL